MEMKVSLLLVNSLHGKNVISKLYDILKEQEHRNLKG